MFINKCIYFKNYPKQKKNQEFEFTLGTYSSETIYVLQFFSLQTKLSPLFAFRVIIYDN